MATSARRLPQGGEKVQLQNAWLDNQALRDVDPRILIQRIEDNVPQTDLQYGDNPGRSGQRLLMRRRVSRRISVAFAIRELRDLAARAALVDRVNGWARDGVLQISTRPTQQIRVVCAGRAAIANPWDYTEELKIDFDAVPSPYWEDRLPQRLALSGSGGQGSILNLGTADTEAAVTVTPTGGALTSFAITLGASAFTLSGLNVAKGSALSIGYDSLGYLYIRAAGASILQCRSASSSDDLIAAPGKSAVSFTANTACSVVVEVRGKWL